MSILGRKGHSEGKKEKDTVTISFRDHASKMASIDEMCELVRELQPLETVHVASAETFTQ